jgi:hypothetical protein
MPRPTAAGMETSRSNSAVPALLAGPCHRGAAVESCRLPPGVSPLYPPLRDISICEPVIYGIGGFALGCAFSLRTF